MPNSFIHDPDAILDYCIDWSAFLEEDDTIDTSTWTVTDGIVIASNTNTTTVATVWLSGGTVGAWYRVTNHIVTAAGREDERTIRIRIRER